ncbi:MAG: hypothetical protein H7263_03130, partial [Candidatus Sericytochromatia bacterium]|nr:hypothetical protein [Candidatus Sericytochromatia bacterium]
IQYPEDYDLVIVDEAHKFRTDTSIIMLPFISQEEKDIITLAKDSILKGKFQKLPRDINELKNNQKKAKLNGTLLLETLLKIIKQYPLEQKEENIADIPKTNKIKNIKPKIIISESFI